MSGTLLEKANKLPLLPGVYIMRDAAGTVIYVGKAKKLKNRVTSYFRGEHLPKVSAMAEKVADFEVVVVNSEPRLSCMASVTQPVLFPPYQLNEPSLLAKGEP